jgi:hypothetical protein
LLNESPLFVFVTKRNERVFDGPYNGQAKTVASLTYCYYHRLELPACS